MTRERHVHRRSWCPVRKRIACGHIVFSLSLLFLAPYRSSTIAYYWRVQNTACDGHHVLAEPDTEIVQNTSFVFVEVTNLNWEEQQGMRVRQERRTRGRTRYCKREGHQVSRNGNGGEEEQEGEVVKNDRENNNNIINNTINKNNEHRKNTSDCSMSNAFPETRTHNLPMTSRQKRTSKKRSTAYKL